MARTISVPFILVCIGLLCMVSEPAFSHGDLPLPPLPTAEEYGDVLIKRVSFSREMAPVIFSHAIHRAKYTCRVCHDELEFSMQAGETPILCKDGEEKGKHCTVCHNGKDSFAPRDEEGQNCKRCHGSDAGRGKFIALQKKLPKALFGNEVDWVKAMNEGLIQPKDSLSGGARSIVHDKTLTLMAEMSGIPSAVFPHKTHEQWLDCNDCHPELFNIKKKTTRSLTMENMLRGESCAVCHLRVAFPLNDCKRCHPTMRR